MTNQRVKIAKDVLKHLKLLKPARGHYWYGDAPKTTGSVKPHIAKVAKNCKVCALGGMFISYVRLFNKLNFEEIVKPYDEKSINLSRDFITNRLETAGFNEEQLLLIERAFEVNYNGDYRAYGSPYDFGAKYRTPRERLKAIMLNIVLNDGEFRPENGLRKPKKLDTLTSQ